MTRAIITSAATRSGIRLNAPKTTAAGDQPQRALPITVGALTRTHRLLLLLTVSACSADPADDADAYQQVAQDVIGGQVAGPGQFPWQAQLSVPGYPHWCGGSLINESWILTAAHCVAGRSPSDVTVTLGEHDRSFSEGHEQVRQAIRMLTHSFDAVHLGVPQRNDIALIQIDQPVSFDAWVQPIRLATADYPAGTDAVISGWGLTGPWSAPSTVLVDATLPLVDDGVCQGDGAPIFDSTLCAGIDWGGAGGCSGDSGGPLVTLAPDGIWELVGIVSFGRSFCDGFTRFTRVSRFRDFVDSILAGGAPFYRLYSGSTGDHLYTTSEAEQNNAVARFGYAPESLEGAIYPFEQPGTVPLYRLFVSRLQDHFYTIFAGERDQALRGGYSSEGIAGFVFPGEEPGTIPLYRLFNAALHDHFYTTSAAERDNALDAFGYVDEGISGYVLPI